MKNLVIFDIDGTLYKGQSHSTFTKVLLMNKIIKYKEIIFIGISFGLYHLNIIKNINNLRNKYYKLIKGLDINLIDNLIAKNFNTFKKNIYKESYSLVQYHKSKGNVIIAISASIEPIIKEICKELSIENYISTKLEIINNKLTGKIDGIAVYGQNKLCILQEYIKKNNIQYSKVIFYSDHISDKELFEFSDIPICVNPDKKLKNIAKINNWETMNFNKIRNI